MCDCKPIILFFFLGMVAMVFQWWLSFGGRWLLAVVGLLWIERKKGREGRERDWLFILFD